MSTLEFGVCLRELLARAGFSATSLANIGAHSLKSTTLSWLARAGVDREVRRVLGYQIKKDERSMEAYSRDSLSGPLRALTGVIRSIAAGEFHPDETRSGYFPPAAASSSAAPAASTCTASSSTCSSPSATPASSVDGSDIENPDLDPENEAAGDTSGTLILNKTTKFVHISDGERLRCGKVLPVHKEVVAEVPASARRCPRCF